MIKILLSGCNGSMGKVVCELCKPQKEFSIVAGLDKNVEAVYGFPVYRDLTHIKENVDVLIDFSHPSNLTNIINYSKSNKVGLVIATTGITELQIKELKDLSRLSPVFFSFNMSIGINLISNILKKISSTLSEDFDIEIIEKHHNKKIDAPSGTAYLLADSINKNLDTHSTYVFERKSKNARRTKNEIGIHSIRGGTIPGEHTIIFAGNDEIIEIKHTALSKNIFGIGALKAAKLISNIKSGFFTGENFL